MTIIIQVKGDVGRFTPVEPAVNHLKRFGVKLAFEIPKLINFFSGFAGWSVIPILIFQKNDSNFEIQPRT